MEKKEHHILRYPHGYFPGGIIWNPEVFPTVTVSGWQDNNFVLLKYGKTIKF